MKVRAVVEKLLEVKNLKIHFPTKSSIFARPQVVRAVDNISFDVYAGEVLGIVGESGCGKSSLARSFVGLNPITAGQIIFQGATHLENLDNNAWRHIGRDIQFIFQDPIASLNPRMTVAEIIAEPLVANSINMNATTRMTEVANMLSLVGLSSEYLNRYPSELSGGQCQRVGIARALILKPKLLICDEAVSALDVSIKAQIINLLKDLQQQLHLTIIFISHDLSVVKHICDRVLVMYLGHVMELGPKDSLYKNCHHPYTQILLSAVPLANPRLARAKPVKTLAGELPSMVNPPVGCVFSTRCPFADDKCKRQRPELTAMVDGSMVACFKPVGMISSETSSRT